MVKKIYLEHSNRNKIDHVLGKFLDHDCYDLVLTEDTDVYEPLTPLQIMMGEEHSEKNILCKFRKGVFTKEMTDAAYTALRSGAVMSDNRGIAAGMDRETEFQQLPDGLGSRRWVTERQKAVLEYMMALSPPDVITGEDQLQYIYDSNPNVPLKNRGTGKDVWHIKDRIKSGAIWIVEKTKNFNFEDWYESVKDKNPQERKMAAEHVFNDLVSDTTYANGVRSGVGGFMDRYPRIPFCRETGWTASNHQLYEGAIPLFEAAAKVYEENLPVRFAGQMEAMNKLGPDWQIGKTPYTTLTINRDFRTAAHRDVGDLCESWETHENPRGFSNLLVLDNGKDYDGFYLCFPEFRVAADIRAGDMIMMNAHRIHSNSPAFNYEEGFERMSVVMYFRESMLECGSKKYEEARKNFVYMRRNNKEHELWHEGWNGVSPGMWDGEEWGRYLGNNGLLDEAEEVLGKLGLGNENSTLM
jgi:hypothetical protein